MTSPTTAQLNRILVLANKLTGEQARYASQSSLDLDVRTLPEASALIDRLQDAIDAHERWQGETGLVIGTRLRHHYVTGKGIELIAEGEITGYKWDGLRVSALWYDATPETRQVAGYSEAIRTFAVLSRLGDPAGSSRVSVDLGDLLGGVQRYAAATGKSLPDAIRELLDYSLSDIHIKSVIEDAEKEEQ